MQWIRITIQKMSLCFYVNIVFGLVSLWCPTCCRTKLKFSAPFVHVILTSAVKMGNSSNWQSQAGMQLCTLFCIDLEHTSVVSCFLWCVHTEGRGCTHAGERRGSSRDRPSLLSSGELQQLERHLEHISFSIITQGKLVWQPASPTHVKVDHVECMGCFICLLLPRATPCCIHSYWQFPRYPLTIHAFLMCWWEVSLQVFALFLRDRQVFDSSWGFF